MGEKTYDAIYKIAKTTESDVIILWVGHYEIRGLLIDCDEEKCIHDIITLQDAAVKCMKPNMSGDMVEHEKYFKWLNIPSCHIQGFTFKCCVIDD